MFTFDGCSFVLTPATCEAEAIHCICPRRGHLSTYKKIIIKERVKHDQRRMRDSALEILEILVGYYMDWYNLYLR